MICCQRWSSKRVVERGWVEQWIELKEDCSWANNRWSCMIRTWVLATLFSLCIYLKFSVASLKNKHINIEGKNITFKFSKNLCRRASITDASCFFSHFSVDHIIPLIFKTIRISTKRNKIRLHIRKTAMPFKFGREHIVKDVNSGPQFLEILILVGTVYSWGICSLTRNRW